MGWFWFVKGKKNKKKTLVPAATDERAQSCHSDSQAVSSAHDLPDWPSSLASSRALHWFCQLHSEKSPGFFLSVSACRQQPCFSDQKKKTSNVEAYVRWFNRLCYLVATEICMVSGWCWYARVTTDWKVWMREVNRLCSQPRDWPREKIIQKPNSVHLDQYFKQTALSFVYLCLSTILHFKTILV